MTKEKRTALVEMRGFLAGQELIFRKHKKEGNKEGQFSTIAYMEGYVMAMQSHCPFPDVISEAIGRVNSIKLQL